MPVPTTYLLACSMKHCEVDSISQMITFHAEFSAIEMTVNPHRNTYTPFQAKTIPKGYVLVTLEIPREIYMPYFYGEFSKALNKDKELSMMSQRERKG
ncbi:MAG: hypothetical protein Q7U68_05720 [Candidatus Roizmanbacteria bacterium]|nr:hypothetical protein [Candidatus Roizmanbacteria bacterium]